MDNSNMVKMDAAMINIKTVKDDMDYLAIKSARHGQRYIDYRDVWNKSGNRSYIHPYPLYVHVDIEDRCNLHCAHCYETVRRDKYGKRDKTILDSDLFLRRLSELGRNNLCSLNIGNVGEPLLNKATMLKIINDASEHGVMDIFIHTNAALMDKNVMTALLNSDLTDVFFSVDACDEETYELVRGYKFNKVINNIKTFISLRDKKGSGLPRTRVSMYYQPENADQTKEFERYWSGIVDKVEFQPFNNMGEHTKLDSRFQKIDRKCDMPWRMLSVWPNGDVGPCCTGFSNWPDIILGNTHSDKLIDLWNSNRIKSLRSAHLRNDYSEFPTCQKCMNSSYSLAV